jgi:mandelate racemase
MAEHSAAVEPFDRFEEALRSLHLLGAQGVTLIAIAALDMAMWDALAKAKELPLVVALGGTVGPVRAYNANGLWLKGDVYHWGSLLAGRAATLGA